MFESHRASVNKDNKMNESVGKLPEELLKTSRRTGKHLVRGERLAADGTSHIEWERVGPEFKSSKKKFRQRGER